MEYVLSDEELRRVQKIQLEMLLEIKRICEKNAIKYNIIAGTLLGAVRHKGYIPWDDDADVALLREEYIKLTQVIDDELDHSKYYFQELQRTPGYRWGYAKLRRKGTEFIRNGQENMQYEQGVFIDIFPLDNISNNKCIRKIQNFEFYVVRKILWSEVGKYSDSCVWKRCVYKLLNLITLDKVIGWLNRRVARLNKKQTEWVRILCFPTPNKEYGYKKCWYQISEKYLFEKNYFMGIAEYDEYLKFKYGDYMMFPKENERKKHSVSRFLIQEDEVYK